MKLHIDWLVLVAVLNVVAALVCALVLVGVSRESWAVAAPVVGWLVTAVLTYAVMLRERGLS